MSWEQPGLKIGSLTASADLSGKQYCFAVLSGAGTVNAAAASNVQCVGVIQNKPISGSTAEIVVNGVSKVAAGAALSVNAEVMADATGRAVTAATTGNRVQGIALEAATAAGQIIAVLLNKGERILP